MDVEAPVPIKTSIKLRLPLANTHADGVSEHCVNLYTEQRCWQPTAYLQYTHIIALIQQGYLKSIALST